MKAPESGEVSPAGGRLLELARSFADDLTQRVRGIVPTDAAFSALAYPNDHGGRVLVGVLADDLRAQHIPLTIDRKPMLQLFVKINCLLDSAGTYLAVDESWVHVRLGERERDEPLFRYEFVRKHVGQLIPSAHIQVHAHRDEFLYLLTAAPRGRPKVLRRKGEVPRMSKFHFPVGGHRFRPCLEDVLQALILEFGIDHQPTWLSAVEGGREQWRRFQLRAAVRDAPEDAAATLESMGWQVTPPADLVEVDPKRLRSF